MQVEGWRTALGFAILLLVLWGIGRYFRGGE